jgi:hypothetical protein
VGEGATVCRCAHVQARRACTHYGLGALQGFPFAICQSLARPIVCLLPFLASPPHTRAITPARARASRRECRCRSTTETDKEAEIETKTNKLFRAIAIARAPIPIKFYFYHFFLLTSCLLTRLLLTFTLYKKKVVESTAILHMQL